ncbi:hypothetical protein O0I10_000708 [Lichtheimia ornata]|uniref:ER membrane protein complex subunit 10 n=1 Tax=Lichtheimia ornata TaxID=688661 RepID=A0AAD8DJ88_9FUNG|nr:uncharacterized protein O0I10_000708 [Lichtheimia ornata]KAJ8663467.1 hypothetical protein O0I10_000708 [Lichtheimia ornata]
MIRLFAIAAFAVLVALVQASTQEDNNASNSAADKIKLLVYHNHDGTYKKRGEITGSPSSLVYTSTIQDDGIDVSSALYQVKVRNEATDQIILSSAKTCQLVASNWADEFRIHFDDQNQVYHIDYDAQSNACTDIELPVKTPRKPATVVKIERHTIGAKPMLGQFGGKAASQQAPAQQQPRPSGKAGEMEELPVEEEKTFFQKYWYLILAGGLMLVNSMAAPPPENAQRR